MYGASVYLVAEGRLQVYKGYDGWCINTTGSSSDVSLPSEMLGGRTVFPTRHAALEAIWDAHALHPS